MNQETERVPPTGPPATAEPDSFPWPRRMTFKDMETFKLCELQYRFRKEKRRKEPRTVYQIVGDLTHMGAAEDNPVAREAQLQEQLLKLAPETRLATEGVVRELIANAHALSNKQRVKGKQKEKVLFVCEATVPGWVLTARPDETGLIPAEEIPDYRGKRSPEPGERPGSREHLHLAEDEVLQLAEIKSGRRLQEQHKKQLFFAAMVAAVGQTIAYNGEIRLVVRLLRGKTEEVFWYQHAATERNMRKAAAVIRKIELAVAQDNFKAKTGEHCFDCPYRKTCPAFEAWQKSRRQSSGKRSHPAEGARRGRGGSGYLRLRSLPKDPKLPPAAGQ